MLGLHLIFGYIVGNGLEGKIPFAKTTKSLSVQGVTLKSLCRHGGDGMVLVRAGRGRLNPSLTDRNHSGRRTCLLPQFLRPL